MNALEIAAEKAAERAYSPYSGIKVGAAVLAKSGKIYPGANIENSSYGLTICAERAAVYEAIMAGERELRSLAVYTDTDKFNSPCGACRQVLAEFSEDMDITFTNSLETKQYKLRELLPSQFTPKTL